MIDRSLNYGRHIVGKFLSQIDGAHVVLDLGAGHGDDLSLARGRFPTARLNAVECHPPYQAELNSRGVNVFALNIESDPIPFDDASVDVVIANQILEHTKELFWIFHEVSRVLTKGGHFIVGVPNLAALHNRLLLAAGQQPSPIKSNSAHVRGFTKPDMLRFVESCFPGGYRLRDFGGSNFYPFSPRVAKPLAAALPTMAWGIFFLFEKRKDYQTEFVDFPVRNRLETNFYTGAYAR